MLRKLFSHSIITLSLCIPLAGCETETEETIAPAAESSAPPVSADPSGADPGETDEDEIDHEDVTEIE
ncbi:hypothetical protein NG895_20965 [Aeoliella sp. ICT_H6.2]|uniref:Uncharacterized protein n=1 Tax=Aeoliella straminimaris TaxID=2954799 RepID=A0A9X2JJ50_9BACT|nr:hypothetical protein [Aeoliella straminimaris]MCO6046378.1 hypothetical protein [Aeoliella straminimaris]